MLLKTIAPEKPLLKKQAPVFPIDRNLQPLQANTWVHLQELPSPYSFSEALLLCPQVSPEGENQWFVWVPDHGEAVLSEQYLLAN
jgi:hypothetical protein